MICGESIVSIQSGSIVNADIWYVIGTEYKQETIMNHSLIKHSKPKKEKIQY